MRHKLANKARFITHTHLGLYDALRKMIDMIIVQGMLACPSSTIIGPVSLREEKNRHIMPWTSNAAT